MSRRLLPCLALAASVACASLSVPAPARAGVVNPDLSVIGQPFMRWTDAAGDPARKRWTFDAGETEFVYDADLNPYARGTFVAALGREGMSLEEGYIQMTRGLPLGLALKAGKYRAGFGKLNPAHPHTLPFAERFGVLAAYLPGDEAFDDTGLDVSKAFALPRDMALTASVDVLQGDVFRIARTPGPLADDPLTADPLEGDRASEPRPALLGRLSLFSLLGERSGLELGVSGTRGTNDVAAATRTTVWGADAKAKLWRGADAYLLLQGEWLGLVREVPEWTGAATGYAASTIRPQGGYLFADWNWKQRYDAGVSYANWMAPERAGQDGAGRDWSVGAFAGLALMEETTVFRIGWERHQPGRAGPADPTPDAVQSLTVRILYSMGPHKAHQF